MSVAPAVSVIIPLYNKAPYVARALDSVLSQTFQDFEILIVNDGSTDESVEIIRAYNDVRIQIIEQSNQGAGAARNTGISVARAELVAFLDADDEWMPEHLETIIHLSGRFPEAGIYGTAYLFGNSNKIASFSDAIPMRAKELIIPSYFKAAALGDPPITSSNAVIPIKILREFDGFMISTWWGEDTDLWGRIAIKYPIAFSWNIGSIYHTEVDERACNRRTPIEENLFVINAEMAIESGSVPLRIEEDLMEYIAYKRIQTAFHNIKAGRSDLARRNLKYCPTKRLRLDRYRALFWAFMPSGIYIALWDWKHDKRGDN